VLRPFGILEMVRTGQVAMTRGTLHPTREAVTTVPAQNQQEQPGQKAGSSEDAQDALAKEAGASHSV
jgi:Small subunit of acetolactate synthase